MRKCDYCKQKCKKTPYGSCVYLTKKEITLCIGCNSNRLKLDKIKFNQNIIKFLLKRELNFIQFFLI